MDRDSGIFAALARGEEYTQKWRDVTALCGSAGEIAEIVLDARHWRVQQVLRHFFNPLENTANIPELLAAENAEGKTAILAIVAEYALRGEDGWILALGKRLFAGEGHTTRTK